MNNWMAEAARLTQQRAPLVTDVHAFDIAKDLFKAWANDEPAAAVAKFFHEVPTGWKKAPQEALEAH